MVGPNWVVMHSDISGLNLVVVGSGPAYKHPFILTRYLMTPRHRM